MLQCASRACFVSWQLVHPSQLHLMVVARYAGFRCTRTPEDFAVGLLLQADSALLMCPLRSSSYIPCICSTSRRALQLESIHNTASCTPISCNGSRYNGVEPPRHPHTHTQSLGGTQICCVPRPAVVLSSRTQSWLRCYSTLCMRTTHCKEARSGSIRSTAANTSTSCNCTCLDLLFPAVEPQLAPLASPRCSGGLQEHYKPGSDCQRQLQLSRLFLPECASSRSLVVVRRVLNAMDLAQHAVTASYLGRLSADKAAVPFQGWHVSVPFAAQPPDYREVLRAHRPEAAIALAVLCGHIPLVDLLSLGVAVHLHVLKKPGTLLFSTDGSRLHRTHQRALRRSSGCASVNLWLHCLLLLMSMLESAPLAADLMLDQSLELSTRELRV